MTWLTLLRAALDERHKGHCDDPCSCYEALCDGLNGTYRFPPTDHGPAAPPQIGCKTAWEQFTDSALRSGVACEVGWHA